MTVDALVDFLYNYRRNDPRAKVNLPGFNNKLHKLEEEASHRGLEHGPILKLVDVICDADGGLGQRINLRLIKCMIPRTTVPQDAALKAISWMCTNKPPSAIQSFLIRWIVLIYEYLDGHKDLHALYGVIFFFLENDLMCPHVCHLLYLLTRREDVRLFRVRALINLQARVGSQPFVLGLLSIYKLYCPQLISVTLPRTPKSFFRQLDKAWLAKIKDVQERNQQTAPEAQAAEAVRHSFNTSNIELDSMAPERKRRRIDLVPALDSCTVHTATSWQSRGYSRFADTKVPMKLIKTDAELLENLSNIELPARIASVLKTSQFKHIMSMQTDPVVPLRLGYWVHHILNEEFFHPMNPARKERQARLLEELTNFSEFIQESMPVWENFLTRYLAIWNGHDHREYIFKLITRLRLTDPEALLQLVLEPLRKLYFASSVLFKCQVIWCLKLLLQNYVMIEWPRYKETLATQREPRHLATSFEEQPSFFSLFNEEIDEFSALQTVKILIDFVDHLSILSLPVEHDHSMLIYCFTEFHLLIAQLYVKWQVPILVLPHRSFIYRLMFSTNAVALARLAELIPQLRAVFHALREKTTEKPRAIDIYYKDSLSNISQFNAYLLEMCNILWRAQGFDFSGGKRGLHSVFPLRQSDLDMIDVDQPSKIFSLSQHPALLGYALKFIEETQPEGRNIHVSRIKDYRQEFLEFMSLEHVSAIEKLIENSINRSKNTSRRSVKQ